MNIYGFSLKEIVEAFVAFIPMVCFAIQLVRDKSSGKIAQKDAKISELQNKIDSLKKSRNEYVKHLHTMMCVENTLIEELKNKTDLCDSNITIRNKVRAAAKLYLEAKELPSPSDMRRTLNGESLKEPEYLISDLK